jgi:hypothetical protein
MVVLLIVRRDYYNIEDQESEPDQSNCFEGYGAVAPEGGEFSWVEFRSNLGGWNFGGIYLV